MKRYNFTIKDEYGNISDGVVDALVWQEAWNKLCILIRAGYKVLSVSNSNETVNESEEQSSMGILRLVKSGAVVTEETEEPPDSGIAHKITFLLSSGSPISIIANDTLTLYVSEWFHNVDDIEVSSTISLTILNTVICLDRMFVGALLISDYTPDEDGELTSEEGEIVNADL